MNRRELLEKIKTFPIIAQGLAGDLLAGDFRSLFRGQGIEFDEVRHYERGDEIRSIDWNVSARFGTPYVKQYREEKEISVSLVLDCSASMSCGSGALNRYDQALLSFALLAFSAERAAQSLGAVFFDREIIRVSRPRKGRSHTMALVSAALQADPVARRGEGSAGKDNGSCLGAALAGVNRLLRRRGLVVVISDFLCVNWEQELGALCRKHDVIALRISDPLEEAMPDVGLARFEDPETGAGFYGATGFASFRKAWELWHHERRESWRLICARSGAAHLEISSALDAAPVLSRFFGGRRRA
ncbi:MAG: DUF58 domain-containing protein [Spirochaetaceae bacterium]|jgi:uncharacterized protein (DUF58 family)|nr:DUF58 domain-containing protein [Spirochaetaceae bacterium]